MPLHAQGGLYNHATPWPSQWLPSWCRRRDCADWRRWPRFSSSRHILPRYKSDVVRTNSIDTGPAPGRGRDGRERNHRCADRSASRSDTAQAAAAGRLSAAGAAGGLRDLSAESSRQCRRAGPRPAVEPGDAARRRHAGQHAIRQRDPGDSQRCPGSEAAGRLAADAAQIFDVAIHPKFAENKWIYIGYSKPGTGGAHAAGAGARPLQRRGDHPSGWACTSAIRSRRVRRAWRSRPTGRCT